MPSQQEWIDQMMLAGAKTLDYNNCKGDFGEFRIKWEVPPIDIAESREDFLKKVDEKHDIIAEYARIRTNFAEKLKIDGWTVSCDFYCIPEKYGENTRIISLEASKGILRTKRQATFEAFA